MLIAIAQFKVSKTREENAQKAIAFMQRAAKQGAALLVLPELFEFPYFPILRPERYEKNAREEIFSLAAPLEKHPYLQRFRETANRLRVGVVFSFFEAAKIRGKKKYFNSSALICPDGSLGKVYRKMHLPSGEGYEEACYFTKGNAIVVSPLQQKENNYGDGDVLQVGMGICWDQWFPEHARAMKKAGADVFVYPSAIGSEPVTGIHSAKHWQAVMRGHGAANTAWVAAANRVGVERAIPSTAYRGYGDDKNFKSGNFKNNGKQKNKQSHGRASGKKTNISSANTRFVTANTRSVNIRFYGHSFIADEKGQLLASLGANEEGVAAAKVSLPALRNFCKEWGIVAEAAAHWKTLRRR